MLSAPTGLDEASTTPPSPAAAQAVATSATSSPAASEARRPPARAGMLIVVLGALTAVGPLATDMYVPGFPSLGATLGASSSAVQLTMTAFLVGLVVGQLVIGPVSDGIGRRTLLVAGSAGFALFSVLCAVAPSVELLTAGRFLQGVSGAVGMVLARAVIMDRFSGADIPRYFALMSQILGVAPILAPVIGGAVLAVSTWRIIFVLLAVVGAVLLVSVLVFVPESLPAERRRPGGLPAAMRSMGTLLSTRLFMGYVLVLAFAAAAMFAYISGSSFVFENVHGVSATMYSMIFASNAVGMLAAGGIFAALSKQVRMNTLLVGGVSVALLGAVAQVVVLAVVGDTLVGTWVCLFVTMSGIGMIFPATMSLGQTLGHVAPGAASALLGGLQFLFGAVTSPVVGIFGEESAMPMAVIMVVALVAGAACLAALSRPWQGHGELVVVERV